jgi:[protein-PII] uridylyltransferase
LWEQASDGLDVPATGAALVAVGGYGRGELSPRSDLDVVLVAAEGFDDATLNRLANGIWYPLWDDNVPLDHAVRGEADLRAIAADDLRVALGLLDMRHVAGDPALTMSCRSMVLADWRRAAKHRLPQLAQLTRERWASVGDLAHATTPDLKDAHGGLRDVTTLQALLASWLVDVPAAELKRLSRDLLDIRDALQEVSGRRSDRLVADYEADVAKACGYADADSLREALMSTGRAIGHLAAVALRNVDWSLTPARAAGPRRPVLDVLAPGIGAYRGEVVLTEKAAPADDPLLALRAAEAAAMRDLVLTDSAAARLGKELPAMPVPWPAEGRALFTRLLGSGTALIDIWESLDQYGVVDAMLPEWKRVRYLRPQSPIHRFTVDRHQVQTCVELAAVLDDVERPDILVIAAILHDLGKGEEQDHSVLGEVIAVDVAKRIGFREVDASTIARLVRHHLTLIDAATTKDLDDPTTVEEVAFAVEDVATLEMLALLTEADALAAGPKAWSPWRKQLVETLVERVRRQLHLQPVRPATVAAARR